MKPFAWGKVLEKFEYDFDGHTIHVIKYHPWKREGHSVQTGIANPDEIEYECTEINEAFSTIESLLIAWIARKNLGNNQHTLVNGLCRALNVHYLK